MTNTEMSTHGPVNTKKLVIIFFKHQNIRQWGFRMKSIKYSIFCVFCLDMITRGLLLQLVVLWAPCLTVCPPRVSIVLTLLPTSLHLL